MDLLNCSNMRNNIYCRRRDGVIIRVGHSDSDPVLQGNRRKSRPGAAVGLARRALDLLLSADSDSYTMWQRAATVTRCSTRYLSSVPPLAVTSTSYPRVPWFIDSSEEPLTQPASQKEALPLPPGVPAALQSLHAQLIQSPYLEPSKLLVRDPIPQPPGPPLPISTPRGRRKRGATYVGEGLLEPGGLWNWVVLAQARYYF